MKIVNLETKLLSIPLSKPFKTALRTVTCAESLIVLLHCDNGTTGFGEAPPTAVITGDTLESINAAILKNIAPQIIGMRIEQHDKISRIIDQSICHNTSAKAAVDIAVYDCLAKASGLPLYQLLGGYTDTLVTDFTVSVNDPDEMVLDAKNYLALGFETLKIKVGNSSIEEDLTRVSAIRHSVGSKVKLRLDANQGWTAKEAIKAICYMEDQLLSIELVEQPVPAWDFEGMKQITESVATPIMADESIFNFHDAARLLAMHGCDMINIKLMKMGGITSALKINNLAEAYGVKCMVGCMVESKVAITAACHFAASSANITCCDLDTPLMLTSDPVKGGVNYQKNRIYLSQEPGLGINNIRFS